MALATYTDLKTSLADWLHRSNLTSQIPDFITLAEAQLNTEMRMHLMESDEALTITSAASTTALPTRFIEPISLWLVISGQQNTPIVYVPPDDLPINTSTGASARPRYYTINGANIQFPNLSDATYSLLFRVLKGFDLASTSTNVLMTKYPGLYLYGSLLQAAPYMGNDAKITIWNGMYKTLLNTAKRSEARVKTQATLGTDIPVIRSRSHIISDD